MNRRIISREHSILGALALSFLLSLLAVDLLWPTAFALVIAVGGVVGALVVVYEVRLTKRIAQAEFIRDLQNGFASDERICEVWRKLLMKEEITAADRPLVSNYLTFFETVHLLIDRGALEWELADDLFRNRFFTAIGDKGILSTALLAQPGAFSNIHDFISSWHDYLLLADVPMHSGYFAYVRSLNQAKGFVLSRLSVADLSDLLRLQADVLRALGSSPWLRQNSPEMLEECLRDHHAWGFRKDGVLVATAILYVANDGEESIKRHVAGDLADLSSSVNLKVVLVDPTYRRSGLARSLVELVENEAPMGTEDIMCTIHPKNTASAALFKVLGYRRIGRIDTSYGRRDVFARTLPVLKKKWAR